MTSKQSFSSVRTWKRACCVALPLLVLLSAGPALALCIGHPEAGTWFNPQSAGTPSKVVVRSTDCEIDPGFSFLVDLYDAYGHVADALPGDYARANDGLKWLRVEPFSDGEYLEHVWILSLSKDSVRVWIAYEALDDSGDFVTDETFSKNAPPIDLSPFRQFLSVGLTNAVRP